MDEDEVRTRRDKILAIEGEAQWKQALAILLLAEVVNEGVIALQDIREALAEPDPDEIIRRDKEASDVVELQAEALGAGANLNPGETLILEPFAKPEDRKDISINPDATIDDAGITLDERSPINQARKP